MMPSPEHTVAVLAPKGVVAFDLAIPCQVLGQAANRHASRRYRVAVCGDAPQVPTDSGFLLSAEHDLAWATRADTVVVPGTADDGVVDQPEITEVLLEAHRRGARLVSICTGAFLLAATGLLDGRRATTHWAHARRLAETYPAVHVEPDLLFVDEGDVLTSAGLAAGIDLCLQLVRADHGARVANATARRLVVAPVRAGGQAQFIEQPLPEGSGVTLAPLRDWMLANLQESMPLHELADRALVSVRTLTRRFRQETGVSPVEWLTEQRVRRAQELLEHSDLPIEALAGECGFTSTEALRTAFRRVLRTTPQEYRRTFAGAVHGRR
ncbi:helix-turn-helix domain-containing protein [Agromyces sp. CFH 90414]|uniref:Helix-turn-helix domain-containing protein n=1 Tax=Agromyces agglutinans TaxID=2662258 RepID=A0A6I2F359_9MICO|nr:helix-turn-helix domain-containing protein [Agromyces agglutinans]MRG58989.1 helix-turn-helix domain-containing protein [Agromyces agglutinans]